jgi:hypothetical protein
MKNNYVLVKIQHPKIFERGIFAVQYVERGKPLLDRYTKFMQIKAKNKIDALRISRNQLR